jgi:hypothetical protein
MRKICNYDFHFQYRKEQSRHGIKKLEIIFGLVIEFAK